MIKREKVTLLIFCYFLMMMMSHHANIHQEDLKQEKIISKVSRDFITIFHSTAVSSLTDKKNNHSQMADFIPEPLSVVPYLFIMLSLAIYSHTDGKLFIFGPGIHSPPYTSSSLK